MENLTHSDFFSQYVKWQSNELLPREASLLKERCYFACPLIYRPVCGTNGITYSNKCNLCAARWKTGINIGIKHEGRCNRKVNLHVLY
uniref:Kazal-like domain-containing protein n=2 Tax=Gopherus TaxID=38771 RepID=A0A8C4WIH0_9SAUR